MHSSQQDGKPLDLMEIEEVKSTLDTVAGSEGSGDGAGSGDMDVLRVN